MSEHVSQVEGSEGPPAAAAPAETVQLAGATLVRHKGNTAGVECWSGRVYDQDTSGFLMRFCAPYLRAGEPERWHAWLQSTDFSRGGCLTLRLVESESGTAAAVVADLEQKLAMLTTVFERRARTRPRRSSTTRARTTSATGQRPGAPA